MIELLFMAAVASSEPVSCPMTLPRQTVTVKAPAGWVGYAPSEFVRLTGFGLMAGSPETMSYLVPFSSSKGKATWRIGRAPRWLYCTYDGSAMIQISRPLPGSGASCTISYKQTKQEGITAMTAVCR
jgi:hypothetical protein